MGGASLAHPTGFCGAGRSVFFLLSATWRGVSWWVALLASPSPFLNLLVVIRAVRAGVGGWGGQRFLAPVLALLLFKRLGQIERAFERFAVRFQAGKLWLVPMRAKGAAAVTRDCDGARPGASPRIWPGRFGWLVRAAAHHAAVYGGQLRVILEQPDMVALLRASPQAGRILRPLCRMLAVETSLLRPRLEGEAAEDFPVETEPVVKVRVRRARVPIDFGRIPLPRGVLSAARRQGFGKGG